ncbi:MAG: ATP-binding protein [Patescibacteria group bacterium]
MIKRRLENEIESLLMRHPAVALLGPRQVGKTTLALAVVATRTSTYLDLETPSDRAKLAEPESYFAAHADELLILDEIQRVPELFSVLRGVIDRDRREGRGTGRFLILGSASRDLLRQSSESLAGRIAYTELGGFDALEVTDTREERERLFVRGGFPGSFLADSDAASFEWRQSFIRTYLERDMPLLGPRIPTETLRRFWTMLAHAQGGLWNSSKIAASIGVSGQTTARYLDFFVDMLLVRCLAPWVSNAGKRLVRSPKVYVRDSGVVHALLGIADREALLGHPVVGASWEGFVIETLLSVAPSSTEAYFYRTAAGAEADLVLVLPDKRTWVVEIKRADAPKVGRGFHVACADINPERAFVVYSGEESFPLGGNIEAVGVSTLAQRIVDAK